MRTALGFFKDVDGGKSELHRVRCRVTPGDWLWLVTESATESRPPMTLLREQARVKGCGKSAPGFWKQKLQGKPHLEQGQIGDDEIPVSFESWVGCLRLSVMAVLDKWSSCYFGGRQNSAYYRVSDLRP